MQNSDIFGKRVTFLCFDRITQIMPELSEMYTNNCGNQGQEINQYYPVLISKNREQHFNRLCSNTDHFCGIIWHASISLTGFTL